MSDARLHLAEWFEAFSGRQLPAGGDIDLLDQFSIEGDDAFNFMESFADRFGVGCENYRWYFHHGEEGTGIGALFFAPPDRRVQRIPITPDMLVEAIETKNWPVGYPSRHVPTVRWDIHVNQLMLLVPVVLLALWLWREFAR